MTEKDSLNQNQTWINAENACKVLNICVKTLKKKCLNNQFNYKVVKSGKKTDYYIKISSLPPVYQKKIFNISTDEPLEAYSNAPNWAKAQVEKYISIIKNTEHLRGQDLMQYILEWNLSNPDYKTSYSCLMLMKQRYKEFGISGLLARYGKTRPTAKISIEHYEYFKNLYLKEGRPSVQSCWENTLGYAMRTSGINKFDFPGKNAFIAKLEREIPKQSIYLARYGESAWNRKYGGYIERDYSNVICGKVWVSDHAQIDVACMTNEGNVVFPWVTAWRDYKSGKWLGWLLQCGHPNSDHIFQTFYYAADNYGLPQDVIIDNGKDYRCKDFAGGRKVIKVDSNRARTTSMLSELNVNVHFALPYNAQTKPIERDFRKIKELISKHCVGYRGGNVVERPEKLAKEIKDGKIMQFEAFKKVFDDFIVNVLNKRSSEGKNHKGLSPDELFNQEFKEKITTSRDALKLFCMRTSKVFTVGRNGIKDNEFGITYWSDWLIAKTGLKVYLRRDVLNYKEAWAFRADNDEFVGKVSAVRSVAALNAETISKEEFKEAMSIKKRNLKVAKAYIKQTQEISLEEQCENYKTAYASIEKSAKPKVSKLANTNMDKAIRKNKEMELQGKYDLSMFITDTKNQDEPLYLFETDKILDEEGVNVKNKGFTSNSLYEEKGVAYGY